MSNKTAKMKQEAQGLYTQLQSSDAEEVKGAMGEYLQLVDRFYRENENLMAPQQYATAKENFEYFVQLLELAEEYHKEG